MDLGLHLNRSNDRPLLQQLRDALRGVILRGTLSAGARLPSSRALAVELGVSRNLVVEAYEDLVADGYLTSRHGSGTFVAEGLALPAEAPRRDSIRSDRWPPTLPSQAGVGSASLLVDFRLGQPSLERISSATWRSLWRDVAAAEPPNDYRDPAGELDLRAAVARHLGRARGIICTADDVVMTAGAIQACDLVVRAILEPGQAVAFEEPGYPTARGSLQAFGARLLPVRVDEDGLRVEDLPIGPNAPSLVYVTPSHQYPLGARLSLGRRLALLEWAHRVDGLIVEDDYDSEFRYDAPPLPALAGLDHEGRVAYVGTFSKVLTPVLRLGYLVAAPALRERVLHLKRVTDFHTSWPVQRALVRFVAEGHLERHIRRMRRVYAAKRAALLGGLDAVRSIARPIGLEAGLHLFLDLHSSLDADAIAADARERGVGVATLTGYFLGQPTRSGLVIGYGGVSLEQAREGAAILASAIATAAGRGDPSGSST